MVSKPQRLVIIPAGGTGVRMGLPYPKQLAPFRNTTVLQHAISLFAPNPVTVAAPPEWRETFAEKLGDGVQLVDGGATRFDSVRNAFEALGDVPDDTLIAIHDAARPFLDPATLEDAWQAAAEQGAVIYAAAAVDTMKRVDADGRIETTLDRRRIFHAQTPQIFRADLLRRAYTFIDAEPPAEALTDEAGLMEIAGIAVHVFPSTHSNTKLTHKEDLALLNTGGPRIGHGYDVHAFDPDRELYLGGVNIPGGPGLAGHSDADVALHALIDAMLGAAGLGDIGRHFPDTDPTFAGIRSTELLARAWEALKERGYTLVNADVTILAQAPKLAPHIPAMRAATAEVLETTPDRINYKATTTERLGFVGRKEGMAAHSVVLL